MEDSASPEGFSNLSVNADVEYDYSVDGALIRDDNKGISSITNNLLGKPQVITYTDGRAVHYTYDAAGTKLTMTVTKEGVTTTTQYVNGFVYEGTALSFFSSPEGRVVKNGNNLEYQFAISDHQGNTRVVFGTKTAGEQAVTATFETAVQEEEANDFPDSYPSGSAINPVSTNNHTTGGSKSLLLNGGYAGMVGMARSYKVYPGDKISLEAYARYDASSNNSSNLAGFATALLNAFALPAPGLGEAGRAASAINDWGTIAAGGFADGTSDEDHTKAFINILVFDKDYQFLDIAFAQVSSDGAPTLISKAYDVKEAGYVYLYLSNENATQTNVYFDDVRMSYTPTNIIQYNEYYPFGLQTASSWTRDDARGNNFLGNGGTEFNATSNLYDLNFRNYDPILGRMNQVDPMTDKYASLSPYNFSFNDPVYFNDPSGAEPCTFCRMDGTYTENPWMQRNDGGGGGGVMMNGQPMYGRDPFGNQYWSGGSVNQDIFTNAIYGFGDMSGISADPVYIWDPTHTEMVNAWEIINHNNPNQNVDYLKQASAAILSSGSFWDTHMGRDIDKFNNQVEEFSKSNTNLFGSVGNIANIFGIGTTIAIEGPKPTYVGPKTWANQIKAGTKFGNYLWYTGLLITAVDMKVNGINTSNTLDATFGVVSFAGVPGAIIGGVYFGANLITTGITGKTIGQHVDDNFYVISTALPGTPFIFIPKQ